MLDRYQSVVQHYCQHWQYSNIFAACHHATTDSPNCQARLPPNKVPFSWRYCTAHCYCRPYSSSPCLPRTHLHLHTNTQFWIPHQGIDEAQHTHARTIDIGMQLSKSELISQATQHKCSAAAAGRSGLFWCPHLSNEDHVHVVLAATTQADVHGLAVGVAAAQQCNRPGHQQCSKANPDQRVTFSAIMKIFKSEQHRGNAEEAIKQ